MEVIERYVYAVTQRLPEQQRTEIKRELHGLIEDMLEERTQGGKASQADAESVLLELGDPNALAAKYRGYDRYLIGPLMFEPYLTTLKIVLISIAIALTGLLAIDAIANPAEIVEQFTEYVVTLIAAFAQGFGWVTIVFAFIDYRMQKETAGSGKSKPWKPSDLPQIPDAQARIKMSDPISGLIFTVLFTVLCLYAIDLLGVWRITDGERKVIPFLNADVFRHYFPIVWVLAALGLLKECVRIIVRRRTGSMLALHVAISVASAVLVCVALADPAIWNPDFIGQLEAAGLLQAGGEGYDTVVSIWTGVTDWLVLLIGLFTLIDVITETYKWYKVKTAA
ncbi:hypothetical protein [Paenibacillus arenilitoris]|uniref:Uncharacterized protein n=1 Tax=Paenibacillus arenilitoris TaxID=2772299 RepID=A0A927CPK5_9BACL|nr:hypothetical protein [Paenibacillus arenilitoris]MBD2870458.1 hypothetical protein [Paenibacillus arenilitoris]